MNKRDLCGLRLPGSLAFARVQGGALALQELGSNLKTSRLGRCSAALNANLNSCSSAKQNVS